MSQHLFADYLIIETMHIANHEYVLGENPDAPEPYVTWKANSAHEYQDGHYFVTKEAARSDLILRTFSSLSETEQRNISLSLISDDLKNKIIDDYREELFLGDTEACLYDAARRLRISDAQVGNLLSDPKFLTAAKRIYDRQDHSYENEALSESLESLVEEEFSHVLPKHFSAVLKISPEELDILQDALKLPITDLKHKYGLLDPGENILQFIQ